jgi:hypothetical protein
MNATTTTATFFLAAALWAGAAFAHCDTPSGPVIPEALAALEAGDVTPLLKWIPPADEPEIKAAFAKTLAVRVQSPEAKELADRYFLETLVRIHRAGEGARRKSRPRLRPSRCIPEAQELADRYLLETLIRLHRAGDAPYAGITDAPVKPIVALADQALADGSADAMIQRMSGHLAQAVGKNSSGPSKPKRTRTTAWKRAANTSRPT